MERLIELVLADGRGIDIPPGSVTCFEAMHPGKNESFPDARSFVRYSFGDVDRTAVINQSFDDLVRMLDINVRPADWLLLTREDGDRIALLNGSVLSREEIADGTGACKLVVAFGIERRLGELTVRETRDEVKGLMEARPAEPMPAPVKTAQPRPRRARAAK